MTFAVLVVCTGNICRSPIAETVLQSGLVRRSPGRGGPNVAVSSRGTSALVGERMPEQALAIATRAGGDGVAHRAQELSSADLDAADLVLTATRTHRSAVVSERPALLRRAFTLREAGRLAPLVAGQLPDAPVEERFAALTALLPGARGRWPATRDEDDLVDPYRASAAVWLQCEQQLVPSLMALLDAVAPQR